MQASSKKLHTQMKQILRDRIATLTERYLEGVEGMPTPKLLAEYRAVWNAPNNAATKALARLQLNEYYM